MQKYLLECCVDSVESAIAAQKGGADRLELCGNLIIGGTTPSVELYRAVRKNTDIPIHVLLRPRFGDFLYTAYELEILYEEVKLFSSEGADGLVIGCLKPDGELDIEAMKRMIELGKGRKITLHRAFDVCNNPLKALEQAIELGVDTILTSGQENSCMKGKTIHLYYGRRRSQCTGDKKFSRKDISFYLSYVRKNNHTKRNDIPE